MTKENSSVKTTEFVQELNKLKRKRKPGIT